MRVRISIERDDGTKVYETVGDALHPLNVSFVWGGIVSNGTMEKGGVALNGFFFEPLTSLVRPLPTEGAAVRADKAERWTYGHIQVDGPRQTCAMEDGLDPEVEMASMKAEQWVGEGYTYKAIRKEPDADEPTFVTPGDADGRRTP